METRTATETHRGHEIEVEAEQVRQRAWRWTFVIDGKVSGQCAPGALLPDAEAALRRGMLAARARVDAMAG